MVVYKITKASDFRELQKSGDKLVSKSFILLSDVEFVAESSQLCSVLHFGVVASKKIGSAVVRNRAKRLMRNLARGSFFDCISSKSSVVRVVFIARAAILERDYQILQREACFCAKEIFRGRT